MNAKDEIKAITTATEAAGKLRAIEASLRERHETLLKERSRANYGMASLEEVLANKDQLIDAAAAAWATRNDYTVARAFSGSKEANVHSDDDRIIPPRLPHVGGPVGQLDFADLCGLAPTLMKARLDEVIRAAKNLTFGLPKEQRATRLAEIDAEIADVERQHSELVASVAVVGIALELLPTVKARREKEQREAERERLRAEMRARDVAPVSEVGGLVARS